MGNPCAPPLAIVFLGRLEQQALSNATSKLGFLVRYIDDYAGIWTHGKDELLKFLRYLNSLHPKIQFTLELDHSDKDTGVPFLDTLVSIVTNSTGRTTLDTEWYLKPTDSGVVLHADLAHPKNTKHNYDQEYVS